jgi:acyl-CoA-dependent ceramide synthase
MLLAVHHLYPSLSPYTAPFFQLSYYQASQGVYVQGWDDIYFVASSAIAFTAIRAIAIDWVLRPIALRTGLKRKASIRFAEQGWMWLYYAFFWTFGMVRIISQSVVRFSVLTVDLVCLVSIQPLDGFQRHLG